MEYMSPQTVLERLGEKKEVNLSWSPFRWLQWLLFLSDARNCSAATTAPSAHRQACCTCSSPPGPVCELSSKNYERLTSWTCIAHLLVLHHPYTWLIIYWLQVDSTDDDPKQCDLGVPPTKKTPPTNRSQAAVKQQVLHSSFQKMYGFFIFLSAKMDTFAHKKEKIQ